MAKITEMTSHLASLPAERLVFTRLEWAALRASTPLSLSESDLSGLQGTNDPVSLTDVAEIYLPLSRLLNLHVKTTRELRSVIETGFLGRSIPPPPYVIGVAGSVAVGKSTFSRILQALLSLWPDHPKVDLITTDGFLFPTRVLEDKGLMNRKGFPESYDLRRMLRFLRSVKAGAASVQAPIYSHENYDIVPNEFHVVDHPDILIFEGLNVLQTRGQGNVVASDFFDFSIYLDAEIALIEEWYVKRFLLLQRTIFQRSSSYFHHYKDLSDAAARETALLIWKTINLTNLVNNILPTRGRADLVIRKTKSHVIDELWLRRS